MKCVCMCCPKGRFVTQCAISQIPQSQEKYPFLFRPRCLWKFQIKHSNPSFFTGFIHYIPMCSTQLIQKKHPPPNIFIRLSNHNTPSPFGQFPSCLLAKGCSGVVQRMLSFLFFTTYGHLSSMVKLARDLPAFLPAFQLEQLSVHFCIYA